MSKPTTEELAQRLQALASTYNALGKPAPANFIALLEDAAARLRELEAELDERDALQLCDCCGGLFEEAFDAGDHKQCRQCSRIAELEAERDELQRRNDEQAKQTQLRMQINAELLRRTDNFYCERCGRRNGCAGTRHWLTWC